MLAFKPCLPLKHGEKAATLKKARFFSAFSHLCGPTGSDNEGGEGERLLLLTCQGNEYVCQSVLSQLGK